MEQAYYDSILDWGRIVAASMKTVPGHPDWGYLGEGGHSENEVRPIAYAAMVTAFLATFRPPDERLDEGQRRRMGTCAQAMLRYLVASHGARGGTCLDGRPWGRQWQSAMWARAAGMAGWMLWPQLDDSLRVSVAEVVTAEADRFLEQPPKSSEFRDTGAEENAWNASIVALACNMLPGHPRAGRWAEAAKRYMYNSLSVADDREDASPGDDGRPIRDWVTTVNAHPDFTLENHGLVHVGYLKLTMAELQENAVHYLAAGNPAPRACGHHLPESWDVLVSCMAWDGSPIYFGGDDWKTFHSQCTDILLYAMRNLLAGDRYAACLEETALDWLRRIQRAENGYYNVRRDLEFGGLCASRLIACCLAHACCGEGVAPADEREFDRRASGVRQLDYGKAILHRTPTKFAAFSWGRKVMGLVMPTNGTWVVWPHFSSLLGTINGQDASPPRAALEDLTCRTSGDSFTATGTVRRFGGKVLQDFLFSSPEADVVVYVERLRIAPGFTLDRREGGIVGHAYDLGSNQRDLYGQFGTMRVTGQGGKEQVVSLSTDWLNLGNRIGYVVRHDPQVANVVRYHDAARGSGRVPELEEWVSLIGHREPVDSPGRDRWACLVMFPNQSAQQTAEANRRVTLRVDGDAAVCQWGELETRVDFKKTQPRRQP